MPAPQRLTKAQAKMIEDARGLGATALDLGGASALERSAKRRTAASLEALGLGQLVGLGDSEFFVLDLKALDEFVAELKEWQTRPRASGKSGKHSEFDRAVILRFDGRDLARWKKLAMKAQQSFKAWVRDAIVAHEAR